MTGAKRVLIVDDHVDLAENLAEILQDLGYDAVVAESAEQALAAASERVPDGVVVDYRLPGKNGVELIRALRERGVHAPVVMVTAFADEDVVEQAQTAGALDVLSKPIEVQRLMDLVAAFDPLPDGILVVEDNAELTEDLVAAFEDAGFRALAGQSVEGALAHRSLPKVALVDLRLPDGSGLDLSARLAARNPKIRILLMTGHADEAARAEAETAGAIQQPVIEKPFDVGELLKRVAKAARE